MSQPAGRVRADACTTCHSPNWELQVQNCTRYQIYLIGIPVMVCECPKGKSYTDCISELLLETNNTYGVPHHTNITEQGLMEAIKNWVKLVCV